MKYFSIPADFKNETLDRYQELNSKYQDSKLIETYGQVTDFDLFNSGRARELLPDIDIKQLESYVKYSKDRKIEFNYTLNPSCMNNLELSKDGIRKIYNFLNDLHNIGVTNLTIAMPSLIELVSASKFEFKIKASAISQISSANKALFYKDLGVDRIVVDEDITRKFQKIKEICSAFGDGVEIIVNSGCYKDCPYKMFHYNHESHTNDKREDSIPTYYYHRCTMQKMMDVRNMIKLNWIRPEDLKYYKLMGINYFKIQGRHSVLAGQPVKILEHYFNEDYDGNLIDLLTMFTKYNSFQAYIDNKKLEGFVETFFDNHSFCLDNCKKCNYCLSYAEKSIDIEQAEELNMQGLLFFNEFDHYKSEIEELNKNCNPSCK
jgi:collagenase-like PrtC family protease